MRLSFCRSTGWPGSTAASRFPLPAASSTTARQPWALAAAGGVSVFVEHLGFEPTDNRSAAARPQRVVLVEAELQMMRLEAGIDERVLHRRRVEHRELPTALL